MTESQIAQNIGRELVGITIPLIIGLCIGFRVLKKKKDKNIKTLSSIPKTKII